LSLILCLSTAAIADSVVSCARPVANSIAVPRTSDEVRRPKINALWLRVSSNALRLRKSPSEEVFAELVAEILCARDIDLAISKLPPSEADIMEL